jgi:membrane associated rhomboid family serine protease
VTDPNDANDFGTPAFYASIGRAFVAMCAVIPFLFLIEAVDQVTGHALDRDGGIVSGEVRGLDGIVFSPFLHGSFAHLYSNAVPLIITGTFVLAGGTARALKVTAVVALFSGLGVWLVSPRGLTTIGASGVIFGYLGYLLTRSLIERTWWSFAVAALVGLLYWSVFANVVPGAPLVSWQAHLFGLLGGVVAALLFRSRRPRPPALPDPTTTTLPLPPLT